MNTEGLFHVLSAIHHLSGDFKRAIEKEVTELSFPKYHGLLEAPHVAGHVYFLERGFAMAFTFNDGEKQVEWFWQSEKS